MFLNFWLSSRQLYLFYPVRFVFCESPERKLASDFRTIVLGLFPTFENYQHKCVKGEKGLLWVTEDNL